MRNFLRWILGLWLLLTLSACGGGGGGSSDGNSSTDNGGTTSNPPPAAQVHSTNWVVSHGGEAVAHLEECSACHQIQTLAASSANFCDSCHFGPTGSKVPGGSTWVHQLDKHGRQSSQAAVCNECHTITRQHGGGPDNCHDCHIDPLHNFGQGWLDKKVTGYHGDAAKEDLTSCVVCHGGDLQGSTTGVGCFDCHFDANGSRIPAGSNWSHGLDQHGSSTVDPSVCNACHDQNRLYGNGPAVCHDCHGTATHATGQAWLDKASETFHGVAAAADVQQCATCHGSDFLGGGSGVSCYSCHFGPDGEKASLSSGWTHGLSGHPGQIADMAVCNTCHEQNRLYGHAPQTCHDCHTENQHPVGQAWLDKSSSTFHGLQAPGNIESCASCHGSDYRGGSSGVSCFSCHFGPNGSKIPDGVTWQHGVTGHATYTDRVTTCNACHNENRLYGQAPQSCHDCHLNANHTTGQPWVSPAVAGNHGEAALQDIDSCQQCHGSDYLGGSSGVSCSACHFGPTGSKVPSAVSWQHGSNPHGQLADQSATCNACHEKERLYGTGPASCHDCHLDASHSSGASWLDRNQPGYHGAAAIQDVDSCQQCHGSDYRGGSIGVSCYSCHFGPTGNAVPSGSSWVHGSTPHGSMSPQVSTCNACHTTSRTYGNGPASCHDCHLTVNHATGAAWLSSSNSGYHGAAAQQDVDSCQQCHGSDYRGGSSGVSCYSCHFGPTGSQVPSGSSWVHGSTPHGSLSDEIATCNACHTSSRSSGNGPASCHDCHLTVNHATGAAWLNSSNSGNHGVAATQNIDSCAACHGSDYRGGSSGVSCYTCHFGPTGSKIPSGTSWTHASTPHGTMSGSATTCNNCHELNRSYGNPPATCHDCHTAVNHATGASWLSATASGNHGQAAASDLASCAACHGSDYRGGSSGVSCYSCHFGPNGDRSPSAGSWTHASGSHTGLGDSAATCNSCHDQTRSFGYGPGTCHDCHSGASHATGQAWLSSTGSDFHGLQANVDLSVCASCHGNDYQGGSSGVSCYSCHFGPSGSRTPAAGSWTHASGDHTSLSSSQTVCNSCHTQTRSYGNGPALCHDCHAGASHPTGQVWLDKNSVGYHGAEALLDPDACSACHGADSQGGSSGVSCYSCHFGPEGNKIPDGVAWNHGAVPHDSLTGQNSVCAACHVLNRQYGNGPTACHDCHVGASHATGSAWLDKDNSSYHGAVATADVTGCASCHGNDYRGGSSGVSCYTCHFGPSGSKGPDGSGWTHGQSGHVAWTANLDVCNSCHTTSRIYGNGPTACHDCHVGTNHATGQDWLDASSADFHGTAYQAAAGACAACHGSDYQGGSSGVGCYSCHFGPDGNQVPQGSSWTHGTTPHDTLSSSLAVCNSCHDQSRTFGTGPASCHDCHVGADHATGQTWLDPNSSSFHGDQAPLDIDHCASCHGSDFLGGSAGVSCYACHFGPSGSKVPAATSWSHGSTPHDTLTDSAATCAACHDLNRQYGNGPASCHDCHVGADHVTGQDWLDPNSANFHGDLVPADLDGCASCHGSDFLGGSSGISCYSCHFGPDGSRSPTGSGWSHGGSDHAGLTAAEAVCNSCHGYQRTYGNGPDACHDCHGSPAPHELTEAWRQLDHPDWVDASCLDCHDSGSSMGSCTDCHGESPYSVSGCVSCHDAPPSGTVAPDRAASHAVHVALVSDCATCHDGAGSGTLAHFDTTGSADVALAGTYNAKTGAASFNGSTCSNVSCHGGKTTPSWQSGQLTVDTNCTSCHASGTGQYNGYTSGDHSDHRGYSCTVCHNPTTLAVEHFNNLDTTTMEGNSAATIGGGSTRVNSYNATTRSCSPSCHGSETW